MEFAGYVVGWLVRSFVRLLFAYFKYTYLKLFQVNLINRLAYF
jgi:hypothetical protein